MSGMVEDLLTLSRIDAHQEHLAREPLDLAALARSTVGELSTFAAAAGVELRRRRLRGSSSPSATSGTCAGRSPTWCAMRWNTRLGVLRRGRR